ncbi:MAG: PAS domain S-box protein [Bacteroidota bacterium]
METHNIDYQKTHRQSHDIRDPRYTRAESLANFGFFEVDLLSGWNYWSPGMYRITGFDSEIPPPTLETLSDWVLPADQGNYKSFYDEVCREGSIGFLEFRHQDRADSISSFAVHLEPEADDEGSVIRLFGTLQEISPEGIPTQINSSQNLQFNAPLNNLLEGCQIIGHDWRYLYLNERAASYGRSRVDSLVGKSVMEMYPGIEHTRMYEVMHECMTDRVSRTEDFEFLYQDGEKAWFEFSIHPIPEGILVLSVDISGRKHHGELIRASERRYQHLFEHMSEGFALCRMIFEKGKAVDFLYLDVNDKFAELTGLTDVKGKLASAAIPGITESDPELIEMYGKVVTTGIPAKFEFFVEAMKMWFSLSVYRPEPDHFVAVFDVINDRKKTEENLRLSRKKYRDMVEMSPDAVWVNRDGFIDFVNPAAVKLFGANAAGDLKGKDVFTFLHPDSYPLVHERIRSLTEGKPIPLAEEKIIRLDGTVRYVESAAERIIDEPGLVIQVIMRDITARKEAELTLKNERDRFSMIAATVPGLILSLRKTSDGTFCVPYASPQIEEVLGFSTTELLEDARPLLARIFPEDRDKVIASNRASENSMTPWNDIYRYQHPAKGELWIEGRSMPVREADGSTIWHGFLYDVTASRQLENSLRESEERFRGLYDNATIGLYRSTPEGRFIMINPAGLQMLGFEWLEEINERNLKADGFLPGYSWKAFRTAIEQNGFIKGLESSWRRKDGSTILIRESAVAIYATDGSIQYYDGTFEDISERKSLEEQAFRWLHVFSDSGLSLAIADAKDNTFLQVNHAFASQRGYQPEELTGVPVLSLYHPSVRDYVVRQIENMEASGHCVFESVHLRKDGSSMPVLVDITLIRDVEGTSLARVAYSLDITEQLQLREKEQATLGLLKICNNAPSFRVLMHNLIQFFKSFSGCEAVGVRLKDQEDFPFYESLGFPASFVIRENHLCSFDESGDLLMDEFDQPALDCMCGNVLSGRVARNHPLFTQRGSFWSGDINHPAMAKTSSDPFSMTRNRCSQAGYETVALVPIMAKGKIIGLFQFNDHRKNHLSLEKVTLLEQLVDYLSIAMAKILAEEEIRKLNEELEQRVLERTTQLADANAHLISHADRIEDLYNKAPCGYHSIDPTGIIMEINDTELEWLGYSRNEIVGKININDLFTETSKHVFTDKYLNFKDKGFSRDLELEFVTRSNMIFPVLVSSMAIYDHDGTYVKSRSSVVNFKEVKRAREGLIEKARLLEETNLELEAFTYSVSHDLRAPLRAIDGYTRILVEDYGAQLNKDAISVAAVIRENTHKMGNLIDDLLAFSRLGKTEMFKARVDTQELIDECLVELKTTIPEKTIVSVKSPLLHVEADRSLLKQVWINLLSNAIKFSSKVVKPEIEISCTRENDQAVFKIRDNGVGFDMKYSKKLFGVFQRIHSQREFEGTGVGLAIVHRIITRHGGSVWADSEPVKGATFYFKLKL